MTVGRAVALWLSAAIFLGSILLLAEVTSTPGDDLDPGYQRPGILDLGSLPEPAPALSGINLPSQRRSVVFFARADRVSRLCAALSGKNPLNDEFVIVATNGDAGGCPPGVQVSSAPLRSAALAYGLRETGGDAAPTGYAIVDERRQIRYATLDPEVAELLDEVDTMIRSVD